MISVRKTEFTFHMNIKKTMNSTIITLLLSKKSKTNTTLIRTIRNNKKDNINGNTYFTFPINVLTSSKLVLK